MNRDGFSDEEMKLPVMLIKEQTFAAAATRACKSIVDGQNILLFLIHRWYACSLPQR